MSQVFDRLDQIPFITEPHVLTIGNFDGVHLGHQSVLQRVHQIARQEHLPSAVLTFSNHPSEILRPHAVACLLCPPTHKYKLLQQQRMDQIIALTFSQTLASMTALEFLTQLIQHIPIHSLVLGHDATIGSERKGGRETVEQIAKTMQFQIQYLPPYELDGFSVSSSLIRDAIRQGQLERTTKLLGRPYSLVGPIIKGLGKGRALGFPTLNIDIPRLCLPPYGVYAIQLDHYSGIANLGVAPTVRGSETPLLEVHLFDHPNAPILGDVEVILRRFIRPEKKFASLEELKTQIAADIAQVIALHTF